MAPETKGESPVSFVQLASMSGYNLNRDISLAIVLGLKSNLYLVLLVVLAVLSKDLLNKFNESHKVVLFIVRGPSHTNYRTSYEVLNMHLGIDYVYIYIHSFPFISLPLNSSNPLLLKIQSCDELVLLVTCQPFRIYWCTVICVHLNSNTLLTFRLHRFLIIPSSLQELVSQLSQAVHDVSVQGQTENPITNIEVMQYDLNLSLTFEKRMLIPPQNTRIYTVLCCNSHRTILSSIFGIHIYEEHPGNKSQ